MKTATHGTSEVAIFGRLLEHNQSTLSEAAGAILEMSFPQEDTDRMAELSAKAGEGTLTPEEQAEINNYEKVGHILALMKSKARRSLKGPVPTNGTKPH